jgi:hypothetical protein
MTDKDKKVVEKNYTKIGEQVYQKIDKVVTKYYF